MYSNVSKFDNEKRAYHIFQSFVFREENAPSPETWIWIFETDASWDLNLWSWFSPTPQSPRQVICHNAEHLPKLPPRHRNTLKIYIFLDSKSSKELESKRKEWKHRSRKLLKAIIFCYQKTIKNRHALHGFLQPWGLWLFALQMCSDSFNSLFSKSILLYFGTPSFSKKISSPTSGSTKC